MTGMSPLPEEWMEYALSFVPSSHMVFPSNFGTPKNIPHNDQSDKNAHKYLESLNLDKVELVYVYGLDLSYYHCLKPWLAESENRCLVFIEDDFGAVLGSLAVEQSAKLLTDPQVYLSFWIPEENNTLLFYEISWFFSGLSCLVIATNDYQEKKSSLFAELQKTIHYHTANINKLYGQTLDFYDHFSWNSYSNFLQIGKMYEGKSLFHKFRNVPAIICGAGPSLNNSLPTLKKLTDKALIFAGGSAITATSIGGVNPHFSVTSDSTPLLEKHIENHVAFESPLFLRNCSYCDVIDFYHGPRLYITGSDKLPILDWFEAEANLSSQNDLKIGTSVSTFSLHLAAKLGCNPIIFVGMDLAYTDSQRFLSVVNVISTDNENQNASIAIPTKDIYQKPTTTNPAWLTESAWISHFASSNPHVRFINATEGGIGFKGISNATLKETTEKSLQRSFPLRSRIHAEIEQAKLSRISPQNLNDLFEKMKNSLDTSSDILNKMLDNISSAVENHFHEKSGEFSQKAMDFSLLEEMLFKEPAFQYILSPLLDYFDKTTARLEHKIERQHRIKPNKDIEIEHLKATINHLIYLQEAAEYNSEMINDCLEN
ncbi:MAG: hypothetical protein ACI9S8_001229 [Chlamydiales bacterium]|jgi:hypothetical protein